MLLTSRTETSSLMLMPEHPARWSHQPASKQTGTWRYWAGFTRRVQNMDGMADRRLDR